MFDIQEKLPLRKSVALHDAHGTARATLAQEKVLRRRVSKDAPSFPKNQQQGRRAKQLPSPFKKKAGDDHFPSVEARKALCEGTLDSTRTLRDLDEATRQRLKKEFEESARSSSLGKNKGFRYSGERHLRDIIE